MKPAPHKSPEHPHADRAPRRQPIVYRALQIALCLSVAMMWTACFDTEPECPLPLRCDSESCDPDPVGDMTRKGSGCSSDDMGITCTYGVGEDTMVRLIPNGETGPCGTIVMSCRNTLTQSFSSVKVWSGTVIDSEPECPWCIEDANCETNETCEPDPESTYVWQGKCQMDDPS